MLQLQEGRSGEGGGQQLLKIASHPRAAFPSAKPSIVIDGELQTQLIAIAQQAVARGSPDPFEGPSEPPIIRRWEPKIGHADGRGRIRAADPRLGLVGVPPKSRPKIKRSAREGWRGRTYSFKANDLVAWNGRLVCAAILDADADGEVTALVAAPLTLEFPTSRGDRTRSPHLLVHRCGYPWLLDCVWERTASRLGKSELWNDIGRASASLGIGYEVLTERHLLSGVRAHNVTQIGRARCDDAIDPDLAKQIFEKISPSGVPLADLIRTEAVTNRIIYRLILDGFVRIDLDTPMDEGLVFVGKRDVKCA